MEQQIQIKQPAEQILADAAAYFARRRAKVSDRTDQGFRFGFEGGGEQEGGRVSVASAAGGMSAVTVEAEGLGVMAIAEGCIRELRKQARDAGRQGRLSAGNNVGSGFSDLRQRLGMPEVSPVAPPRPGGRPNRPVSAGGAPGGAPLTTVVAGAAAGGPAAHPQPLQGPPLQGPPLQGSMSAPQGPGLQGPGLQEDAQEVHGAEAASQPSPVGAGAAPASEPVDADPSNSAVPAATAAVEVHDGAAPGLDPTGQDTARLPQRELAMSTGDAQVTTGQQPGHESMVTLAPSAEQVGGVPDASDVHLGSATGAQAVPGRQTPGPASGEPAGEAAPPER